MINIIEKLKVRFFIQSGFAYAAYLKEKNFLHHQGSHCFISKAANIADPYLTHIGSNVWITSGCQLLCHDASVIMLNKMTDGHLDAVGPIIIGDNSFLGNNVIVLPHITIGRNTVVGAGSLVTKDIPENTVYAGNPVRQICSIDAYLEKVQMRTKSYPWKDLLLKNKTHVYDLSLERELKRERITYFFNGGQKKD